MLQVRLHTLLGFDMLVSLSSLSWFSNSTRCRGGVIVWSRCIFCQLCSIMFGICWAVKESTTLCHFLWFLRTFWCADSVDLRAIQKCATRQEKYLLAKRLIKAAYSNNNTPPQCSKVGKDSDAYRLPSYERQKRTQEIAFQKKNSTRFKRVQDSRWTRQGNCTISSSHTRYCTDFKQLPPPTTSGIGKPRKAA